MLAKRIIPCLDIKDGRTVKGVHFLNLRDAGDPVEAARASQFGSIFGRSKVSSMPRGLFRRICTYTLRLNSSPLRGTVTSSICVLRKLSG